MSGAPETTISLAVPRPRCRLRVVLLDEREIRRTSSDALRIAGICDGDCLCDADVQRMVDESEPTAAMNRALRLLGHRERSVFELTARLSEDGYPEPVIDAVVSRLTDFGYVDDARFAEGYARAKRSSGWGRRRIAAGLAQKGVAPDVASDALEAYVPDAAEVTRALEALHKLDTSTRAGAERALRRLITRGFSYDTARAALEHRQTDQGNGSDRA